MTFRFVGEEGFEPPHPRTRTLCLTAWLLPNITELFSEFLYIVYQAGKKINISGSTGQIERVQKRSVDRVGFYFHGIAIDGHEAETFPAVGIFRDPRLWKLVVERIGIAEYELVDRPDFPAAVDVFVAVEDRVHLVGFEDAPQFVAIFRFGVQTFFLFGADRIGGRVEKYEGVFLGVAGEIRFKPIELFFAQSVFLGLFTVQYDDVDVLEIERIDQFFKSGRTVPGKVEKFLPEGIGLASAGPVMVSHYRVCFGAGRLQSFLPGAQVFFALVFAVATGKQVAAGHQERNVFSADGLGGLLQSAAGVLRIEPLRVADNREGKFIRIFRLGRIGIRSWNASRFRGVRSGGGLELLRDGRGRPVFRKDASIAVENIRKRIRSAPCDQEVPADKSGEKSEYYGNA